jgi:hypothetical protein
VSKGPRWNRKKLFCFWTALWNFVQSAAGRGVLELRAPVRLRQEPDPVPLAGAADHHFDEVEYYPWQVQYYRIDT